MIPVKTPLGQQVLKDRSLALTLRQRAALIVIDGRRTVAQVLQQASVEPEDITLLLELALITGVPAPDGAPTQPASLSARQERSAG